MPDPTPISEDARAELVAYLDGELDAAGRRRVEARLQSDPRLHAEADAYRQTWALLDHLPAPETSPTFASRTLVQIASKTGSSAAPSRFRPLRLLAWAAGILLAAGIGYALTPARQLTIDLDSDPVYKADPRLIENLSLYLAVENMDYLHSLDTSELFGEDAVGR